MCTSHGDHDDDDEDERQYPTQNSIHNQMCKRRENTSRDEDTRTENGIKLNQATNKRQ